MGKKIAAALLALSFVGNVGAASAEQAAAEKYRRIVQAGNFAVEYKDKYTVRIIAQKDGKRMERTKYETNLSWMKVLNPLGMIFGGSEPKYPEVLYKDGKYYQFTAKDKAIVCDKDQLDAENLDPRQGWNGINRKLALPMEIAVFYWEDPYREQTVGIEKPALSWSGKKSLDGKEYDCDRYVCNMLSAANQKTADYVYDMLYEKGELKIIQSYIKRGDTEYPVNTLSVKTITDKISDNLFKIEKDTKIYGAGMGDMSDLLEQPVQVGNMEGI